MNGRLWLAIGFGLVLGAVGYLIGKSQQPGAPPAAISCVANANLIFDATAGTMRVDQKPFRAVRPDSGAQNRAVCWSLVVENGASDVEFERLKIVMTPPSGMHGRPILVGDLSFGKHDKVVWARFDDEPIWTNVTDEGQTYQGVRYSYAVEARLKGATQSLEVDPDMILRKSG